MWSYSFNCWQHSKPNEGNVNKTLTEFNIYSQHLAKYHADEHKKVLEALKKPKEQQLTMETVIERTRRHSSELFLWFNIHIINLLQNNKLIIIIDILNF